MNPPRRPEWLTVVLGVVACVGLAALPRPNSGLIARPYLAHLPMPTPAAWNAPTTPPPVPEPADASGMGAYFNTMVPEKDYRVALDALDELGARWVRTEVPWALVEPEKGIFRWDEWDRAIHALSGRGHRIMGMFAYWSTWVTPYTDESIAEFERYCERVSSRYRNEIEAWEVWNEPNEGYWKSTPERYADLVAAASRGMKRGNPRARLIIGSTSGVDVPFLRRVLAAGANRHADAISVHPYPFGWAPDTHGLIEELRGASQLAREFGLDPGLWLTEFGPQGDGVGHANRMERTLVLIWQSRVVERWMWFRLYHPTEGFPYSLYSVDWEPKVAVRRFAETRGRIARLEAAGRAVPADNTPPWGAGHPLALAPMQSWLGRSRSGEWARVSWVTRGSVRVPDASSGDQPVTTTPRWETGGGSR